MLYDAAVIGLGAHGSSISAHLASRGVKVLGLEKYAPAHKNGSSHGRSRIFRTAYFEDPAYVPLLVRSLVLWKELNAREKAFQDDENSEELLKMTGALMIGAASDIEESESESLEVYLRSARGKSVLGGTYASIREHGLEHEILSAAEVKKRYGCFNLDDSSYGGSMGVQCAALGIINFGGMQDSHKILWPDLATNDEQILKEKFNQIINNATLHNTYIENAFIQAQAIYSHKSVKERFLKII